jgi:hypothetical protein
MSSEVETSLEHTPLETSDSSTSLGMTDYASDSFVLEMALAL